MNVELSLDRHDLKKIFALTAVLSVVVSLVAFALSPEWAINYGVIASMAYLNWMALSLAIIGWLGKRPIEAMAGIMMKPLLLVLLIVVAKERGIEISSFVAGLNTFFITLFGYIAARRLFGGAASILTT